MNTRSYQLLVAAGSVLAVLVLQTAIIILNAALHAWVARFLSFTLETFVIALLVVLMGIASGLILALLLVPTKCPEKGRSLLWVVVVGIIPLLAVAVRLGYWANLPVADLFRFAIVRDWVIGSEFPPLWLGLVVGWSVRRFTAEPTSPS